MLAVFILLGAAGLSGIGHSSSTSDKEAAAAGATAPEQICEAIDQCAEASLTQGPVADSEPARGCPPDHGDTEMAAGADELPGAGSIDVPRGKGLPETVAEPFAGAQDEKSGTCTATLTPQNLQ